MTMWERARLVRRCGNCNVEIAVGEPYLQIRFDASPQHAKVRCQQCAGPAPPDLPDRVVPRQEVVHRFQRPAPVPLLDYKQRQSRESGEDG